MTYILSEEDRRKLEEAIRLAWFGDNYAGSVGSKEDGDKVDAALSLLAGLPKAPDATQAEQALLAFDEWLNEPPSREVSEPREVRTYRFDAYRRWTVAAEVLQRFIRDAAMKEHPPT